MAMTKEELAALRRRYRAGESLRALAKATGLSKNSVAQELRRAGEVLRSPSRATVALPADARWWLQQFETGHSVAQIAQQLRVSSVTIYRHLIKMGIPRSGSKPTFEQWLAAHTEEAGACLRWVGTRSSTDVPTVQRGGHAVSVNRLVWEHHHGALQPEVWVVRTDECALVDCVRLGHLRAVTVPERMAERVNQRRFAWGQEHWNAKLSEDQARQILSEPATSTRVLAERYGVSQGTINGIRAGRRWRHLHDHTH